MACLNKKLGQFFLNIVFMFCFIHCPNLNKTELIHTRVVVINIKETKALYIGLADKTHPKNNTIPAFDFQKIARSIMQPLKTLQISSNLFKILQLLVCELTHLANVSNSVLTGI